jgi:hypothetical protein
VNDSSLLQTLKIQKKNQNKLYYLQNVICTNNTLELQKEEEIAQYESDKSDTGSEYTYILQNYQGESEIKYRECEE